MQKKMSVLRTIGVILTEQRLLTRTDKDVSMYDCTEI